MPPPARLWIGTEAKQQNNDCLRTDMRGLYVVQAFGILLASVFGFMVAVSQNDDDEGTYEVDQFVRYYGL
jgi:hypothetical protein